MGAAGYLIQNLIHHLFAFSSDIDHFVALDIRDISPQPGIPLSFYHLNLFTP